MCVFSAKRFNTKFSIVNPSKSKGEGHAVHVMNETPRKKPIHATARGCAGSVSTQQPQVDRDSLRSEKSGIPCQEHQGKQKRKDKC
ncbi:hypothetical protein O6P43_015856 [Quillaja saponaria]|uniref:Uncharacterized protein n=1 Tax=Quillaja saponaria TaxID=32244 RepID=A0AAD7LYA5_QUISA|nr:hypothetical protein O6P43_015856 [Quillaja saponaria]